jgi:peptide deformylase
MLPLIIAPNEVLRRHASDASVPLTADSVKLGENLAKAVRYYHGIGLAAPQVNQSVRIITVVIDDKPVVYVNPVILKLSKERDELEEGCLSLPGVFGIVERPERVFASFITLTGESQEAWLEGWPARIFQHEVDHLDGILFTDKTKRITGGHELLERYGVA